MAISIISNNGKTVYNLKELIADTFSDLPKENIEPGSKAFIVDEQIHYMLNSSLEWIEIDTGNVTIKNQPLVEGEYDPDTGVPTIQNPKEGIIYMVPSTDPQHTELYNEYVYVHGNWEKFGHAEIELDGYATIADLDDVAEILDYKASKTYVDAIADQKLGVAEALALQTNLKGEINKKQNALAAGTNIEIKDDIISTIGISDYNSEPTPIGFWLNGETIVRQVFKISEGLARDNLIKVCDRPADMTVMVHSFGIVETTEGSFSNNEILIYASKTGVYCKQNFTNIPKNLYIIIEYAL